MVGALGDFGVAFGVPGLDFELWTSMWEPFWDHLGPFLRHLGHARDIGDIGVAFGVPGLDFELRFGSLLGKEDFSTCVGLLWAAFFRCKF